MNSAVDAKRATETQPATIIEAYNELSQEAFAIWMRLLVATDTQLRQGRKSISSLVGYSEGRSNAILRELKLKGYIRFVRGDLPGIPTQIEIVRKALISGPAKVIRLGKDAKTQSSREKSDENPSMSSLLVRLLASSEITPDVNMLAGVAMPPEQLGIFQFQERENPPREVSHFLENHSKTGDGIPAKKKRKKQKFMGLEGGYAPNQKQTPKNDSAQRNGPPILDLSRMRVSSLKEKSKRSKQNAKRKRDREKRPKQKSIELTNLDRRGKPAFKFECSDSERKSLIATLDRAPSSPLRRALIEKIETQTARLYTRYRRQFNSLFELHDDERKYMRKFGELCIRKCVTVSQALTYWNEHIHYFANRGMKVPTPSFLSSPANIDTVAVTLMVVTGGGKKKYKPGYFREEVTPVHSYDDTSKLHRGLRKGLESAGFETSQYSDRALMSYQSAAMQIAEGYDLFIPKNMRPMVEWAAVNIFSKSGDDEK